MDRERKKAMKRLKHKCLLKTMAHVFRLVKKKDRQEKLKKRKNGRKRKFQTASQVLENRLETMGSSNSDDCLKEGENVLHVIQGGRNKLHAIIKQIKKDPYAGTSEDPCAGTSKDPCAGTSEKVIIISDSGDDSQKENTVTTKGVRKLSKKSSGRKKQERIEKQIPHILKEKNLHENSMPEKAPYTERAPVTNARPSPKVIRKTKEKPLKQASKSYENSTPIKKTTKKKHSKEMEKLKRKRKQLKKKTRQFIEENLESIESTSDFDEGHENSYLESTSAVPTEIAHFRPTPLLRTQTNDTYEFLESLTNPIENDPTYGQFTSMEYDEMRDNGKIQSSANVIREKRNFCQPESRQNSKLVNGEEFVNRKTLGDEDEEASANRGPLVNSETLVGCETIINDDTLVHDETIVDGVAILDGETLANDNILDENPKNQSSDGNDVPITDDGMQSAISSSNQCLLSTLLPDLSDISDGEFSDEDQPSTNFATENKETVVNSNEVEIKAEESVFPSSPTVHDVESTSDIVANEIRHRRAFIQHADDGIRNGGEHRDRGTKTRNVDFETRNGETYREDRPSLSGSVLTKDGTRIRYKEYESYSLMEGDEIFKNRRFGPDGTYLLHDYQEICNGARYYRRNVPVSYMSYPNERASDIPGSNNSQSEDDVRNGGRDYRSQQEGIHFQRGNDNGGDQNYRGEVYTHGNYKAPNTLIDCEANTPLVYEDTPKSITYPQPTVPKESDVMLIETNDAYSKSGNVPRESGDAPMESDNMPIESQDAPIELDDASIGAYEELIETFEEPIETYEEIIESIDVPETPDSPEDLYADADSPLSNESFSEKNDDLAEAIDVHTDESQPHTIDESDVSTDSHDIAKKNKFYNSMTSKQVFLHLRDKIYFHGGLKVRLLAGNANIFGYTLPLNEEVTAHSLTGQSFLYLSPESEYKVESDKDVMLSLNELSACFSDSVRQRIISDFNSSKDAIVILERDSSNKGILMIEKYLENYILPNVNPVVRVNASEAPSECNDAEMVLHCQFSEDPQSGLKVNPKWADVVMSSNSRQMIIGGKCVGKSTLLRYLINKNLKEFQNIVLIDLDIGQPEIFLPQTISATIISKPLLGPGYLTNTSPQKAYFFDYTKVLESPSKYLKCVGKLFEYCRKKFASMPWIVNTMGDYQGIGLQLIPALISALNATDVIQIEAHESNEIFFTTDVVNDVLSKILFEEGEVQQQQYAYTLYPTLSPIDKINNLDESSSSLQLATILSRLANRLPCDANLSNVNPPFYAPLDELKILMNDDLVAARLHANVINGNFCYLCKTIEDDDGEFVECYGICLVKGVDMVTNKVYILPSVAKDELPNVKALAACKLPFPACILTNYCHRNAVNLPYMYCDETSPPLAETK